MAMYVYEAQNIKREKRKGRIKATSLVEATEKIKDLGFKPISIIEQEETLATKDIELFNGISTKYLVQYLQQFATLINSGISVVEASQMLAEQQENKKFKVILEDVSDKIQSGETISESFSKYPKAFPPMLISVIRAAETSGTIETSLNKMALYYERKNKSQGGIVTAMIYPIIMLMLTVAVGIFLIVQVVPMFVDVFDGLDAELPAITKFTLRLSDFMKSKGWIILVLFILIVIGIQIGKRNDEFHYRWDLLKLKIPLIGELTQKSNISALMSTLSTLLASSIPVGVALEMSKGAVTNLCLKQLVQEGQLEIERGGTISSVFSNSTIIPSLVTQMIRVGENTGALETTLNKLSDVYEQEVEMAGERIKTIAEPLIILFIASMVGFIVAAIMLPMFSMYDAVQG